MKLHKHRVEHRPKSGTGYAVCQCGATLRLVDFEPVGEWHTCSLCVSDPEARAADPSAKAVHE